MQPKNPRLTQGASAKALVELGSRKGYELIAVTKINLLFAEARYYPAFRIRGNSLELMRDDSECPQIFIGYDGHVFLSHGDRVGGIYLPWHHLVIGESSVQILPAWLQTYPDNFTPLQRLAFRCRFELQRFGRFLRRLLGTNKDQ